MDAASEVLESMCFLSVLGEAGSPAAPNDSWMESRLEFMGESRGSFGLCMTRATAAVIAGNFLGQPSEEFSAEQIEEVLCELSNMICGSFLSRFCKDAIFDLTHPVCGPWGTSVRPVLQGLELDEGELQMWLEFRS
jgi:CheY-specific phosphatase CheX